MNMAQSLQDALITRALLVDDDLSTNIDINDLSANGGDLDLAAILSDGNHDITCDLDGILTDLGLPHASALDRVSALKTSDVRDRVDPLLKDAFERAQAQRAGLRAPLDKIKQWVTSGTHVTLEEWTGPKVLPAAERFDLLIIDYFLVGNSAEATIRIIREFKAAHADQPHPLLVILMSSDIHAIEQNFESIRDSCEISASRFRILAKPVQANPDDEATVKEKWIRALSQLASERALVAPIENFVKAWERSLGDACKQMVQRLYDMDASAFALIAATAQRDSMSIEEYLADVLSRRISAECEEKSFPFSEIESLENALESAKARLSPTINQGVEVRHAQHAIRSLMSDVVWHRREWWEPRSAIPEPAVNTGAEPQLQTAERLAWMKRYVRFGTILREKQGSQRFFVNLTQACDVQSERLCDLETVNYLLMRGEKLAIDRVTPGEKSFDSPYYCNDLSSDEFFTFHWRLRQPHTPSMATMLNDLEAYEIVGQLRSDSSYAVLAKYVSQASRVAQIRMPKVYRYSVLLCKKQAEGAWVSIPLGVPIEASAWQRDEKYWRLQFTVDMARKLLPHLQDISGVDRDRLIGTLIDGVKVETKTGAPLHVKAIDRCPVILGRVDGKVAYDERETLAAITSLANNVAIGSSAIVTYAKQ
jgi:hypothetical protein